jgi:hypothetical protein
MSCGAVMTLITNDGKQDRMLQATGLLNMRLRNIERQRSRNPDIRDPTPTLADIEKTHILFVNAHFKPYAAIGYEYNRVAPTSGNVVLGGEVQFSIPQFGDFFNDMALHVVLDRVEAPNAGYWEDPELGIQGTELIRYVDFVGQRLAKKTNFSVNGNPLDEYTSDVYNFHQKIYVQPNKQVGWNRNVGQELPRVGYCNVQSRSSNSLTGVGIGLRQGLEFFDGPQTPKPAQEALEMWIPLLFWFNLDPRLSIPSVSIPYGQRFINVQLASASELLQTVGANGSYKAAPQYDGTVNVSKCELYINNIFMNPEVHDIFIKRVGFSMCRVHRLQNGRINKSADNVLLNQLKWPIETIYVGLRPTENTNLANPNYPESWHMYAKMEKETVGLCGMEKSYRFDVVQVAAAADTSDVQAGTTPGSLYYEDPVTGALYSSAILVGASVNLNAAFNYDNWAVLVKTVDGISIDFVDYWNNVIGGTPITGTDTADLSVINEVLTELLYPALPVGAANNISSLLTLANYPSYSGLDSCNAYLWRCHPTIGQLGIEAHGIELYKMIDSSFYNSYLPYTFGGQHIRTPDDCGVCMITFNLYPGAYQPSGYINISRAREFYLKFTSAQWVPPTPGVDRTNPVNGEDLVDNTHPADLVVVAIAINFLLISDGSAVLRYST